MVCFYFIQYVKNSNLFYGYSIDMAINVAGQLTELNLILNFDFRLI